jgi:hypothetical protein
MKEYPVAPDLMDATASFARPQGFAEVWRQMAQ